MDLHLSDLAHRTLAGLYEYRVTALAVFVALLRAYRDWVDQPAEGPKKGYLYHLFGLLIAIFTPRQGGTGQLSGRVAKLEDLIAQVLARLPPLPAPVTREDPPPDGVPPAPAPRPDVAAGSP